LNLRVFFMALHCPSWLNDFMRRLMIVLVAAWLIAPPLTAQQPQQTPTFRSSVTLVTVDVVVLDRDGKPVPGLTADDFQIKLNGKVQPVRALSYVQVAEKAAPLTVTDVAPDEPVGRRVVTNATPAGESRIFVLMVDDLSFAPSGGKSLFAAASRFIERQPVADYVGLSTTSGDKIVNPTLDRALLVRSLDGITGAFEDPRRPTTPLSPTLSIQEALDIVDFNDDSVLRAVITRECFGGNANDTASLRTEQVVARNQCAGAAQSAARMIAASTHGNTGRQVAAVIDAIRAMKPAKGLKQLVLMSQGIGVARNLLTDFEPIARAAAESNVQLSVLVEEGDDLDSSDPGRSIEDASGQAPGAPEAGLTARRREDRKMFRSAMQTLADASGGYFQSVIGMADRAFDRAAVAGSALYRLGVETPADAPEGRAFSVSTSVRRSGVTVQANRQAVMPGPAPAVSTEAQLTAAISEGQPFFGVPIRLAIAKRRAASGQIELVVGVDVPASVPGPLTMAFGVVGEKGELRTGKTPLAAPPDGSNYRFTFPYPVAAGKYHLRFAVTDATGGIGSVDVPVDAHLGTVGTLNASDVLTWWTDKAGKSQFLALDEVPAGVATLGAGLELYPPPGTAFPADLKVKLTLIPTGTSAALLDRDATAVVGNDTLRADTQLPLDGVPAGSYTLRATVTAEGKTLGTVAAVIKKK
jgi:VWFA-related protein